MLEEYICRKGIDEFHSNGKSETGKHRSINLTFKITSMLKEVLQNPNKLHEKEEFEVNQLEISTATMRSHRTYTNLIINYT